MQIGGRVAAAILTGSLAVAAAACGSSGSSGSAQTGTTSSTGGGSTGTSGTAAPSNAPGVTATEIRVGAISTLTGTLASNFESLVPGVEAYFDYVNAKGGINGRKLVMANSLDDGGNPSQFNQLAQTLINQDHVFAVVGVATAFFSPNIFQENGIPTYGYDVTGNWSGAPNLFAAGGSVQCTKCGEPEFNWWVHQVQPRNANVGLLALGFASSANSCKSFNEGLTQAGIKVGFTDFNVPYGGNPAPDVKRMQQAGVNTFISCMDVNSNIAVARAMKQYGYTSVKSLWLNGNDQPTLDQYQDLMQNVWFSIAHVPFSYATTAPSRYPGLVTYINAMKKYQPKWTLDEVALQGWESAALFAQAVKAAGSNLTQANVVAETNKITNFTAGLFAPVNWTEAHDVNLVKPPYCAAWIQVQGDKFVPAFNKDNGAFLCFGPDVVHPTMVTPPAGTPGA